MSSLQKRNRASSSTPEETGEEKEKRRREEAEEEEEGEEKRRWGVKSGDNEGGDQTDTEGEKDFPEATNDDSNIGNESDSDADYDDLDDIVVNRWL